MLSMIRMAVALFLIFWVLAVLGSALAWLWSVYAWMWP
jgi:hypothetical protein